MSALIKSLTALSLRLMALRLVSMGQTIAQKKDYEMDVVYSNSDYALNHNKPLLTQFREGHRFMRATAIVVLCCFAVVFYSPAVNATVKSIDEYLRYKPDYPVFSEMDSALAETQQLLQKTAIALKQTGENTNEHLGLAILKKAISQQREIFSDLDEGASDYFADQRRYYTQQQLPQRAITVLDQKQQRYQREMATLQDQLQRIDRVQGPALQQEVRLATALLARLYNPIQHPYDQTMPFGPLDAVSGAPVNSAAALESMLGVAPVTGDPVAADTTATLDAPISPAIQQLANDLSNDEVAIYNWVHNNIEFIPSYGSLQGADYTLQTRRGNAFDQASLLVALLRAANIPARYQYGNVWITLDEVMNWVGGVRVYEAAQNLLGQGGIPSALLSVNGTNKFMTMEHVWVQLWDGSQWVEVDPSFKQYQYTEGMDLQSEVSFDAEAFANTLQSTATVNETEGWVQNVNQAFIETELEDYRQALEDYLTNQQPEATVGDVIGSKTIIETTSVSLPTQLPYNQIVVSQALTEIPDHLRYKFTFKLQDQFGGELLSHTATTVELAGQSLAISFNPATAADEQALLDYLPDNPQSAEDLPNIIPAGLMNVVGELTASGQVVASSAAMSFGQVLQTEKGYFVPGRGWSTTINPIITGEYQAIGLDYHGISPAQLQALQTRLEATKAKLEAEEFTGLTKHEVVGDLMQSGVMSYMAITDVQSRLAAQSSDIVYYREPSYGTFQTNAKTNGLLGTVTNVEMTGLLMDMDSMKFSTECKSNCWGNWRDFNQQMGSTYSAYEHLVPEQLFSTDEEPVEGISAVKALAIASQQGQRIYTFTQDNLQYLSDLTVDQGTVDEIRAQVENGMVATVHQNPISYAGWTGAGYTIVDPETGAGGIRLVGG
ncbi:transglutaminase family protein [Oceanicoccus sp. KOV_DT_Chl]|uniref:transglutaminase-like domain-containing protein n=1 Tax=Oceanicoccus sp. KOV_DT_Chl TaxID=1904639 RepID=UPI00135C06AE|nr:transglutaminase-like domain-containing protein [Oceanicoccus sp. KOV_DT_Chl]